MKGIENRAILLFFLLRQTSVELCQLLLFRRLMELIPSQETLIQLLIWSCHWLNIESPWSNIRNSKEYKFVCVWNIEEGKDCKKCAEKNMFVNSFVFKWLLAVERILKLYHRQSPFSHRKLCKQKIGVQNSNKFKVCWIE